MRVAWTLLVVLAASAVVGCASPHGITPEYPQERYRLATWPRQSVSLEVVDARTRRQDSAGLVEVTRGILAEALAAAGAPPGPPRQLFVEIIVHDVSLQGPLWVATTRFRATLFEGQRAVHGWEARGDQRRTNWVPANARDTAQEAYERGIADLVSKLEQAPP